MNYRDFSTKARSEIPEEYKWDLSAIYKSIEEWQQDFNKLPGLAEELNKHRGKLSESPLEIKTVFELEDQISLTIEKLSAYARHKYDEDSSNNQSQALCGKISSRAAEIEAEISWIDPEILKMPKEKLIRFANSAELAFYKKTILDLIREKDHTLSEGEERLLEMASDALSSSYETFNLLSNADLRFPKVKKGNGEEIEITQSNFVALLREQDREIRKEVFEKYYSRYEEFKNSFAAILDGTIKTNVFETKARKFRSCLEAALFEDKIPSELYFNLIKTVRNNLNALFDYFRARKRVLNLEQMHIYDLYHQIVPKSQREWRWQEAKDIVLKSVEPLGDEYRKTAEKAFAEGWIDVLPNRGKKSGAYSGGAYGSPPYILLNYNGMLDDVFTLAHELGHSIHSFYSNKTQAYHYADYSIFLAEIASISSELLLHDYLLRNSQDKNLKILLLNHFVDEFRATVIRQTMFAEFELLIHQTREQGEPLTADFLNAEYFKLIKDYFGSEVFLDQLIEIEWARIPHFHYGFYVYKYATGFAAAAKFAERIISGERGAAEAYIKFISSGCSKDVLEILADSGINPLDKNFISDAFRIFSNKSGLLFELIT